MKNKNNETNMNDYLSRNLEGSAKEQVKKLSPKDFLALHHNIKQLYNSVCISCKNKMMCNPSKFKNINDLCSNCQENKSVINIFKRLEKINERSKNE